MRGHCIGSSVLGARYWGLGIEGSVLRARYWGHGIGDTVLGVIWYWGV